MSKAHEILGVPLDATDEEITLAFRRAAAAAHPDRGGTDEEFQVVRQAYESLQNRVCPVCEGKSFVTLRQGVFVSRHPCPKCWRKS